MYECLEFGQTTLGRLVLCGVFGGGGIFLIFACLCTVFALFAVETELNGKKLKITFRDRVVSLFVASVVMVGLWATESYHRYWQYKENLTYFTNKADDIKAVTEARNEKGWQTNLEYQNAIASTVILEKYISLQEAKLPHKLLLNKLPKISVSMGESK